MNVDMFLFLEGAVGHGDEVGVGMDIADIKHPLPIFHLDRRPHRILRRGQPAQRERQEQQAKSEPAPRGASGCPLNWRIMAGVVIHENNPSFLRFG